MEIKEIMLKIEQEDITVLQEEVKAQFDNRQQTPLGFVWRKKHYEVLQLLQTKKEPAGQISYLVLTDGGVFKLVLVRENEEAVCRSKWVLQYRVNVELKEVFQNISREAGPAPAPLGPVFVEKLAGIIPGPENMFVPLELAAIANYHGHLCPELAVGYRAGLIARASLNLNRRNAHEFFVVAENLSSAIDALQYLTGCTFGNQSFYAYETGKHVYYFARYNQEQVLHEALRISLINPLIDLSPYQPIAARLCAGKAAPEEVSLYHRAISQAVKDILNLPEESLFTQKVVSIRRPQPFSRHAYSRCARCGEVVAAFSIVAINDRPLCPVCAGREK
ncbi:MAG: FmdE family protein [Desulfotomaculales bacterium]